MITWNETPAPGHEAGTLTEYQTYQALRAAARRGCTRELVRRIAATPAADLAALDALAASVGTDADSAAEAALYCLRQAERRAAAGQRTLRLAVTLLVIATAANGLWALDWLQRLGILR